MKQKTYRFQSVLIIINDEFLKFVKTFAWLSEDTAQKHLYVWDFSFLAAIMRNNSVKRPWIENGKGFAVHSSTWPSGAKGERRVSSWLAKSKTRKNYIVFFYVCCYSFSQSWKSLCNTAVYMIKNFWTQGTFVAILSRIAHLKSWRGTVTWHPKEWLWGKGDLTTQSKSVAGTFSFLNVLIEEDSEMCKYINYVNWRLALHWKRFAALGETLAYGKYPLACWQLSNIIGSKQILLKIHFFIWMSTYPLFMKDEWFLTMFTVDFPPRTFKWLVNYHVFLGKPLCTSWVWTLHFFQQAFWLVFLQM